MAGINLMSGSTYKWDEDADYIWKGADTQDQVGNSMSGGDVDGDGYDDL